MGRASHPRDRPLHRTQGQTVVVRADAAFALTALYESLERRGVAYAIRLPANAVLERDVEDLLVRPRGRSSHAPLGPLPELPVSGHLLGPAARVIAKVEHTSWGTLSSGGLHRHHPDRDEPGCRPLLQPAGDSGAVEGKEATHWTRLSCHRFRANEVRLLLGVIAYNHGNLLRRLALPVSIQSWSLTSLQQRLFKTCGRLIRHARYFILQLAEAQLAEAT